MAQTSAFNSVPVTVAIPAFRNERSLAHTLEKIFACSPLPQEVLLHLDGGWEPAQDFSLDSPVPVRVLRSAVNVGPGGGRHRMLVEAACDVVASFDDDSWPLDKDYFAKALALMDAFPNAAVMSPAVYLKDKSILPAISWASTCVCFEGSASVTRRSLYLQLPGYVPVAQAYGIEEADLSLQASAAGFTLLNSPWLRAWHDRPQSDDRHGIEPWVRNEVLLSYLRYPRWLQPWGWWRAVRHIVRHWNFKDGARLLRAMGYGPAHCTAFRSHQHRYSWRKIWAHHSPSLKRWELLDTGLKADGRPELNVRIEPVANRVLYIQYTNPGAYPPLQHSSRILARAGWEVHIAGLRGGQTKSLEFPAHPGISVHQIPPYTHGWRQKAHYLRFTLWVFWQALRLRPSWIYCSDPLSSVPGLLVRSLLGSRVVYHEHDSPGLRKTNSGWFARQSAKGHQAIASVADAVVLPNAERLAAFDSSLHPTGRKFCVWNCPALDEVPLPRKPRPASQPLTVMYHGSIIPDHFPFSHLQALALCGRDIKLVLIGYEAPGSRGYTQKLQAEAQRLGVASRFEYVGPLPRYLLMQKCGESDVGLSLLQIHAGDINMLHLTGASNKAFDYLSQGLAIIVPDDPEWQRVYVERGCAVPCKAGNAEALAKVFAWMDDHRDQVRSMGLAGQQHITQGWNYETEFQPVVDFMTQHSSK